ncbi:GNAT family N-acetyltransferase [Collinsella sp. zg1085]|uniref:GNAT family N-acetyltransferase n=1 Tax=Collinsella sp. zg1085 TaxID=2844380 RepID=UPI001C0E5D1E|nr:GNAT family N-acetyltransferase [Collinsella sp. zg1085]QWT17256.1 GNAT family N-acetyltransferase [Collinsella sp. zg1085]
MSDVLYQDSEGITIRMACPADEDAVTHILHEGAAQIAQLGIDQWQTGYPDREEAQEDIAAGQCMVLETSSGNVVASLALCLGPDTDYEAADIAWQKAPQQNNVVYVAIHRCATLREATGHGYMKLLFEVAAQQSAAQGAYAIRIDTHPGNTVMRAFLQSCGYRELGPFTPVSYGEGKDVRIAYELVI